VAQYVTFRHHDIGDGFDKHDPDAPFLDVANPWDYSRQAYAALLGGGFLGSIVSTANQVINLISTLEDANFSRIAVEALLLCLYKLRSARLRPKDPLRPHTGYPVLGRNLT